MKSLPLVPMVEEEPLFYSHGRQPTTAMPMETIARFHHAPGTRERRRNPRVTPDPFLVIRLSSGTTGIVLDVSHDGLGFLASAPVEETEAVRFAISGRSTPSSEAAGQLMWKDPSGKRAGLKFTQLPEELRALIRSCLPTAQLPRAAGSEPKTASAKSLAFQEPVPAVSRPNPKRWTLAANTVTGALACLIALGIWYSMDRRGTASLLLHWREVLAKSVSLHRTPSESVAPAKTQRNAEPISTEGQMPLSRPASADVPSRPASSAKQQPVPHETGAHPKLPSSVQPVAKKLVGDGAIATEKHASLPTTPEDPGQTQLALARELLQKDAADSENQAKAAQLLWQAVEKGNVGAEIELANLYLLGRGVAKSCRQARVLLTAAQSRKSELAGQELDDFPHFGCE